MLWFRKKNKSKKNKKEVKEIKRPDSSYDIYNQSETLTLQTELNNEDNLSLDYDNNTKINITNTLPNVNNYDKSKSVSKSTTKKSAFSNKTNKKGRNIYYISARKDSKGKKLGWEVKKENAEKVTKLFERKEEAIEFVKEKAENQGSTCIIRKLDGSIDKTLKFDSK